MRLLCIAVLLVLGAARCAAADLPRSRPEAQGVSPRAVLAFVEAADRTVDFQNPISLGSTALVAPPVKPVGAAAPHTICRPARMPSLPNDPNWPTNSKFQSSAPCLPNKRVPSECRTSFAVPRTNFAFSRERPR